MEKEHVMAQAERATENKKDARAAAQQSRRREHYAKKGGDAADWQNADAELLRNVIATVAAAGGAIRFGYTRDGGAFAVGIYENGNMKTEYLPPDDDMEGYLKGIVDDFKK
jgi:hypothetical protein